MIVLYISFFGLIFLLNWGCVVYLAPWVMGLEQWLEDRLQGKPTTPIHFRRLTYFNTSNSHQPQSKIVSTSSLSFLPVLALSIAFLLAAITPAFASGLCFGFGIDNFFLIFYLLLTLPFFMLLSGYGKPAFIDIRTLQFFLFDNILFLPTLFVVGIILKLTTNEVSLGKIVVFFHSSNPFPMMAYCPLLTSAFVVLLMTWNVLDFKDRVNTIKILKTSDKLLYLYAYDIQFLVMLSLISLFIWPNSLIYFDTSHINIVTTLCALPFAVLAWIAKIVFACVILAIFRSIYLLTANAYKARLAFIVSIVSIITYFTGLK